MKFAFFSTQYVFSLNALIKSNIFVVISFVVFLYKIDIKKFKKWGLNNEEDILWYEAIELNIFK